jgi:hypothetical protein
MAGNEPERRRRGKSGRPRSKRLTLLLGRHQQMSRLDRHLNSLVGGLPGSTRMGQHVLSFLMPQITALLTYPSIQVLTSIICSCPMRRHLQMVCHLRLRRDEFVDPQPHLCNPARTYRVRPTLSITDPFYHQIHLSSSIRLPQHRFAHIACHI